MLKTTTVSTLALATALPIASLPSAHSYDLGTYQVPLFRVGDNFAVSANINGMPTTMLLDTGAEDICLDYPTANALISLGLLTPADMRGETVIGTAGSDHQAYRIRLRSVTVGGLVMNNIPALVGCDPTLLGQIYLKGLKSYAIDNERSVLVMIPPTPGTSMPDYSPPSTYTPPPIYSSPPAYTPPPSTYSAPPAYSQAFVDGRRDRQAWESWFNEVPEGTYKEGADYWSSVRSTAQAAIGCRGSRYIDTYEQQTWANGCEAARARLDHSDRRRNNEPDYKAGWNGL